MRRLLIIIMALVMSISGVIAPVLSAQAQLDQIVATQSANDISGETMSMRPDCDDPCPGCNDNLSTMGMACHWACMAAAAFVFAEPIVFNLPEQITVKHPLLAATCAYKALAPPSPPPRLSILT
jgi:hypothetical protein